MYPYLDSIGTLSLTEASPTQSFIEPIEIQEAMDFLVLDPEDYGDPAVIAEVTGLIQSAREQAEILQNRDLVRKQWDLVMDYWPCGPIRLRPDLVSVDLLQYRNSDGSTVTMDGNSQYIVDRAKQPGIIVPPYAQTWPPITPWPTSAILVRFTCGLTASSVFWADSGSRVKIGMRWLISLWFNRKIPLETGAAAASTYDPPLLACLSQGAIPSVR